MGKKQIKTNAALNVIKQTSNIIFPLITYPYLARVLGDSSLGKYSFADSIVGFFMILAALGVPNYAIREGARVRENKEKLTEFTTEIFSISILAMIISYLFLVASILFVPRLRSEALLIEILSINIFTSIAGRDWLNSIYEDFLYITIRYIAFQTIALVLVFMLIKSPHDYVKYTIIMVIANSGGSVLNIFYTRKYAPIKITKHTNLKKHARPIIYLFCVSMALTVYVKSDVAIIGFLRSDGEVGVYTLASKIYIIIKNVLNAIIIVATPRIAFYLGSGELNSYNNLLNKMRKCLYVLIMPCITGAFSISFDIMSLVGGRAYAYGYHALQILCIALFFAVFAAFYASAILLPNRDDKGFFYATIVSAITNVILNILIIPKHGIAGAAFTTLVSEACVLCICRYRGKKYIKPFSNAGHGSIIIGCIAIIGICSIVQTRHYSTIAETMISIVLSAIVYAVILLIGKNEIAIEVINSLKMKHR